MTSHAYDDGLHGGRWVPVRGILRWVPSDSERAPEATPGPAPEPARHLFDPMRLIACPTCRARLAEPCRTTSGTTRTAHAARLVARVCKCGEKPYAPSARYCTTCRDAARRITWNNYAERRRKQRERGEQVAS